MLVFDFIEIGNRLLSFRKRAGLTQAEVAEKAGLSDRTYADIERGSVNMRIETVLRICQVLHITPDALFAEKVGEALATEDALLALLHARSPKEQETALKILSAYLNSLN